MAESSRGQQTQCPLEFEIGEVQSEVIYLATQFIKGLE
jgi:hypothetical protein